MLLNTNSEEKPNDREKRSGKQQEMKMNVTKRGREEVTMNGLPWEGPRGLQCNSLVSLQVNFRSILNKFLGF